MKAFLKRAFELETLSLSKREHLFILAYVISVMPFFRGGRDPLGVLFSLTILFFIVLLWPSRHSLRLAIPNKLLLGSVLGYLAFIGISLFWSADRYEGLVQYLYFLQAGVSGLVALAIVTNQKQRKLLIRYFLFGAACISLIGFYMYLTRPFDRATSLFFWPNPLAGFLGIALLLGGYEYIRRKTDLYFGLLIVVGSAFVLTASLASFIFFVFVFGLLVVFMEDRKKWLKSASILLIASVLVASLIQATKTDVLKTTNIGTPDEVTELVDAKTSGVRDRVMFWEASFEMFLDAPIVGVGGGGFSTLYPQYQVDPQREVGNPHNIYVHIAVQYGVIGVALMLGVLAGIAIEFQRGRKFQEVYVYAASTGFLLLHAGFYQTDRYPALLALFALVLALLTSTSQRKTDIIDRNKAMIGALLIAVLMVPAAGIFSTRQNAIRAEAAAMDFRVDDSIELYERAHSMLLVSPDDRTNYAWQLYLIGERDAALRELDKAIADDPNNANHHFIKGFILKQRQRIVQAEESFQEALRLDPINNPRTYVAYGDLLIKLGRLDEAKELLDTGIALYPDEVIVTRAGKPELPREVALLHYHRAQIADSEWDVEGLYYHLNRVVELRPDYAPAVNWLKQLEEIENR